MPHVSPFDGNAHARSGADIRFIQVMLGHAKLEATEIYTRLSIKKLQQVYNQTHPAEQA